MPVFIVRNLFKFPAYVKSNVHANTTFRNSQNLRPLHNSNSNMHTESARLCPATLCTIPHVFSTASHEYNKFLVSLLLSGTLATCGLDYSKLSIFFFRFDLTPHSERKIIIIRSSRCLYARPLRQCHTNASYINNAQYSV
jgi:hypothetical protein